MTAASRPTHSIKGLSTQSLLARIELSIGRVLNFIFVRFLVLFGADICFQNGLLPKRHAVTMGILSTPSTTNRFRLCPMALQASWNCTLA